MLGADFSHEGRTIILRRYQNSLGVIVQSS